MRCAAVIDSGADGGTAAQNILHAAAVDGGVRHLAARQHLRRSAVTDSDAYGSTAVTQLQDMTGKSGTALGGSGYQPVDAPRREGSMINDCPFAIFLQYTAAHDAGILRCAAAGAAIDDLRTAAHQGGDRARAARGNILYAAAHGDDRAHAAAGVEIADVLPAAVHGADRSAGARVYRLDAAVHARDRARAAAADELRAAAHGGDRARTAAVDVLMRRGAGIATHSDRRSHAAAIDVLDTVQDFHGTGGGGAGNYLNTGTPYADDRGRAARGHVDGAGGKGVGVVINRDAAHHPQRAAGEGVVSIAHGRTIGILEYGTVMNFQHTPGILGGPGRAARPDDLGTAHAGADVYRGTADDGIFRHATAGDNLQAASD